MNIFQAEIEQLKTALAAALPGVRVNGSLIEHEELRRDELLQGVVTVLLERIKPNDDWGSTLQLLITGQGEVIPAANPDNTGALVEAAELDLYARLRAWLRNSGGLPNLAVADVEFSAQSKVPFGWFLLRAQYGPINEACTDWSDDDAPPGMYPPGVVVSPLGGVDIKVDIEPHESVAVHQKWLLGEPTAEKPDMNFTVELNNGN